MKVLVSDTSVLIDLDRAGLIERIFSLPYEFAVPDLLFQSELQAWGITDLRSHGLRVEELTSDEVRAAVRLKRERDVLSTVDTFAYCLAQGRGWVLLTGDGELRTLAEQNKLEMHGALWIFDELERCAICTMEDLHAGLIAVRTHPRCRLPTREMNVRLKRYAENS